MATSEHAAVLSVEKADSPGTCRECGATGLKQHPVLSEGGWFMTVKCQRCLASASREPWNRLGYVTRLEDTL